MPTSRPPSLRKKHSSSKKKKRQGKKFSNSRSSDGFKHHEELNLKKKMIQFVKEEYQLKKPREIRLMKMKPKTVFKRGTILPNVMIRAIDQTVFLISLDFGEELRFYLIDGKGQSLGASTLENTQKIQKELYGKAITLYRLPKISQNSQFDVKSIELNKRFKKQVESLQKKWGKPLHRIPTVSLAKNSIISTKLRFGAEMSENILHFDPSLVDKSEFKVIFWRELFLAFWNLDEKEPAEVILATFWAMCQSQLQGKSGNLNQSNNQQRFINNYFNRWQSDKKPQSFEKILQDRISHLMLDLIKQPASILTQTILYIETFISIHQKLPYIRQFHLIKSMLYYLTQNSGIDLVTLINQYIPLPLNSQLVVDVLNFIYSKPDIVEQYNLISKRDYGTFTLWALYFTLKIGLIKSEATIRLEDIAIPLAASNLIIEKCNICIQLWNKWQWQELFDFITQEIMNEAIIPALVEDLSITLYNCFENIGIRIIQPPNPILKISENSAMELSVILENHTDIIFSQANYTLEIYPEKGLSAKFLEIPHASIFDTQIKFKIKFIRANSQKKHFVKIFGSFDHPLVVNPQSNHKKKKKMCLFTAEIR
ncbi:MAG: hypothetical protein DRO88_08160 [Promethearchaeia archaeon]|nr:MAG: hypothetical protein DRO88_08160 [Candidatus Lokiarchaeia archaeon]